MGLNPLSKPFEYITLNGKLVLYPLKACTDQLRKIHGISITQLNETVTQEGLYIVKAYAQDPKGRVDVEEGAVHIANVKGDNLAVARMKAITKAKRRVTLSICGLTQFEGHETEALPGETAPVEIPQATVEVAGESIDTQTGEVVETRTDAAPQPADTPTETRWRAYLKFCGECEKQLGEDRYYGTLGTLGLETAGEVDPYDMKKMRQVGHAMNQAVKDHEAQVAQAARAQSAAEDDLDEKVSQTLELFDGELIEEQTPSAVEAGL